MTIFVPGVQTFIVDLMSCAIAAKKLRLDRNGKILVKFDRFGRLAMKHYTVVSECP